MKLLPFDLEEAKKGAKLCDRLGREVLAWMVNPKTGAVHYLNFKGQALTASDRGRFDHSSIPHDFDLFMAPKIIEGWINIYSPDSRISSVAIQPSKYIADETAKCTKGLGQRVACIKIYYTDGEGL